MTKAGLTRSIPPGGTPFGLPSILLLITVIIGCGGCSRRPGEVGQPDAELYWQRCAVGQSWDGSVCTGQMQHLSWDAAKRACPEGYRLPTRQEYVDLLGECSAGVHKNETGDCRPCADSRSCKFMFGSDGDAYWSSTSDNEKTAWVISLGSGRVHRYIRESIPAVRCMRKGE